MLRQDDAPAAQEVVLYAENGAVDFRAQPAQRWIAGEPESGSLPEDEEAVVTVTTARPQVSIGGVTVAEDGVLFSGSAPTPAAVDMAPVEVPAGIEPSAAADVLIAIGGRTSQAGVTVAVE